MKNLGVESEISRYTSKYRRKRQLSIFVGGFLGIILLFIRTLPSIDPPSGSQWLIPFFVLARPMGQLLLFIPVVISIILFTKYHIEMNNIEMHINEADEALDDTMIYIDLLQDIGIGYSEETSFTRSELRSKISEWMKSDKNIQLDNPISFINYILLIYENFFRSIIMPRELDFKKLAQTIGVTDFLRLLIRKGQEKELIEEIKDFEGDGVIVEYQINV